MSTTQFDKRKTLRRDMSEIFSSFNQKCSLASPPHQAATGKRLKEYLRISIFNNKIIESVLLQQLRQMFLFGEFNHRINISQCNIWHIKVLKRWIKKNTKIPPILQENICFALTTLSSDRVIDKIQWSFQRNNNWLGTERKQIDGEIKEMIRSYVRNRREKKISTLNEEISLSSSFHWGQIKFRVFFVRENPFKKS